MADARRRDPEKLAEGIAWHESHYILERNGKATATNRFAGSGSSWYKRNEARTECQGDWICVLYLFRWRWRCCRLRPPHSTTKEPRRSRVTALTRTWKPIRRRPPRRRSHRC